MDHTSHLKIVLQQEVAGYADADDWRAKSYYLGDDARGIYAVIFIPNSDHPDYPKPDFVVLAHTVDDTVIIYEDITDRPLWEILVAEGIPREKLILAYIGEKVVQTS